MVRMPLILVLALIVISQTTQAKVRGIPKTDAVYSKVLSENRELLIHLPNSYRLNADFKYPVLYLTDGLRNFNHAAGTLDLLTQSYKTQEMIIVAIKNTHRTRDFTPTYDESYNQWGISGGADNFLDFIEKELIPYIDNTYRTSGFNVLSGHSLGGLLSIYALQTRPEMFQAYFAFSPSLWWHEQVIVEDAQAFFAQNKTLNNTLYLNLTNETGQMKSAFDEYIQIIQSPNIKNFEFDFEVDTEENHSTSALVGLNKAYVHMFNSLRCPSATIYKGLSAIEQCYKTLSNQYGAELSPTYDVYRQAASGYLKNDEFEAAIGVFDKAIERFPYNADAYFRKAYALKEHGNLDASLEAINKALEVSGIENVENNKIKTYKKNLVDLRGKN